MQLLALLACSPSGDTASPSPDAAPLDTGLDLSAPDWTEEDAVAGWGADEVAAAFEDNATRGFASAQAISMTFLEFISHGDENCPPGGENFGATHCLSEEGYAYSGISIYNQNESHAGEAVLRQWTHVGDYVLTRPDGTRFETGGGLVSQTTVHPDRVEIDLNLRGSWKDEGATAGWFKSGVSWLVLAQGQRDAEGAWLSLDGGITTARAVYFEDTVFSTDASCPIEGPLRIQGDDGYWYRWEAACDGCGPVSFQDGTELGEICPELEAWASSAMALVPGLGGPDPEEDPP